MVTLFVLLAAFLACVAPADAIPILQLYVEGGSYDTSTDTWVHPSSGSFGLWVMGNIAGPGGKGTISNVTLYAAFPDSVPLSPSIGLAPTTAGLPGWTDPSTPGSPTAGTRVTDGSTPSGLSPHGIYGSTTDWVPFALGTMSLTDSPVADLNPPCDPATVATCAVSASTGAINAYLVSLTGFPSGSFVHFDVTGTITKPNGNSQAVKAPFSHDGAVTVAEPGALLLLGSGLVGLAAWSRRP